MKLTALAAGILALGIVVGFALRATVSEASRGRRHSIHEQPAHARDETATITTFSLSPDTSALHHYFFWLMHGSLGPTLQAVGLTDYLGLRGLVGRRFRRLLRVAGGGGRLSRVFAGCWQVLSHVRGFPGAPCEPSEPKLAQFYVVDL